MGNYGIPRRAKRDGNEKEIVKAFLQMGCTVERSDKPLDLLVGKHGRTHLVEVKVEGEGLNDKQKAFVAAWKGDWCICRSVDDVVETVMEWDDWAEDEARRQAEAAE